MRGSKFIGRRTAIIKHFFLALIIYGAFFVCPKVTLALTSTISTQTEFELGTFSNTESYTSKGNVKLKDAGQWGSTVVNSTQLTQTQGGAAVSDGTYMYVIPANDVHFNRYNPVNNTWKRMANPPFSTSIYRADMVYLNGYIYLLFGGYQKKFARYDVAANTWTEMEDLPDYTLYGASISTDGTNLFVLRSSNTTDMWKYTVSSNTWSSMAAAPAALYTGSDLAYSGGYFYTPRGNNTTTFYRYSVSGNSWSTMTAVTATINGDHDIIASGDYIYVTRSTATNTFYRYSISGNSWTTLTNTPQVTNYHSFVYVSGVDKYYLFRGNGSYDIWTYSTGGNSFASIIEPPAALSTGANLTYSGGDVYLIRGTSTNLYGYDVATNTWTTLAVAPGNIAGEQKAVVAGGLIYYFASNNTTTFYSYNIAGNSWSTLAVAPATINSGGSLAYPGSGDYIYATRGQNTGSFYRYSISGNSWSDVAVADLPSNILMGIGSRILSDGTDIYAFTGSTGKPKLYKYVIGTDTWSAVGDLPFSPYYGTDADYYSGKFYVQTGYYRLDFWEYTISSNTWRRLEKIPGFSVSDVGPYAGGALVSNGSGTIFMVWGSTFQRMTSYTVSSDKYKNTGTWTSGTIDLTYVSSFTSLTATSSTPGASSITYETRTSADGSTWAGWQSVSGSTIASTANRYIQVRATLNADTGNADTPILSDITITYAGDSTAPTNPSSFTGSSQQVSGTSITTGNTYSHVHPYFSWSGATDAASTIAGYYVYFGTSSSADPESAGAFQTASTFVTTETLTNGSTYYLRLKTKDSAGNISAATTGFTYVYSGVTATSATYTSSAEFTGTNSDTVSTGDEIKLAADAGGIWEQERISLAPATLSYGANWAYVSSSNKLYTFRGIATTTFYSYDIATDVWATLAVAPGTVNYGWVVEGPSGYLYGARGSGTSSFWRYDITNNTWDDAAAADAPLTLSGGSSAKYDGSRYIYVTRGSSDDAFFRYDTQTDSWDTMTNVSFDVLNAMYQGGDLAYDGGDTIYAAQGGGYSGFSKYSITSNTWSLLPALPLIAQNDGAIAYVSSEEAIYYTPGNNKTSLYKYDIASEQWSELNEAPATFGQGADLKDVNGKLYAIRGNTTQNIYTYDTTTNAWLIPTLGIYGSFFRGTDYFPFSTGADIVKGNSNYYYIARGNIDTMFTRYDAATGSVLSLADAPVAFSTGSELVYESTNNKIYAIGQTSNTGFYQYDIATDTWSEITTDALPAAPGSGASLVYDGSQYIYYARGGSTTSFYRYDTQGSAGTRWSTMTAVTATLGTGADLIYKSGFIYTARGQATTTFYRYSVAGNSWSTMTAITGTVSTDGFAVDGGDSDSLIVCRGGNTAVCYKYSIAGNSWTTLDTSVANYNTGAAGDVSSGRMYSIAGAGTNTFSDGLYSYVVETASTSFEKTGNYISQVHDFTTVYKFSNLSVTYTEGASGTTITPYTRSSADNSTWTTWTAAASTKTNGTTSYYEIKSPDNRYLQVRFDLTSGDGLYTDVINSYTVNYYTDASAPTNPTSLTAYTTATQSATMTTNTWYSHTAPNFDWPDADAVGGATDGAGGSGIDGYYVYFGTNSSADPAVDGALQTTTAYTAGSLSSGSTYYLRIKAIDDAGNVAATSWQPFIYKLDTTVPTNPTTVTADPPGYTATNSFDFSWNAGSDADSGIAEYCYKTGAVGAVESCTASTTITDIAAYQSGANTFYVRAKDTAGNFASSYVNASYYYSSTAPSAPQNVTADPSTNTINEFGFSWDPPSTFSGAQENLRYYYSVNALPTSSNVNQVGLSVTYLSDGAYATQAGENTFYVVAKDEAGNIDYNVYGSVAFTADTSAPGIPTDMEMADVSDKSTEAWKLAITWNAPSSTGSGIANYKLYRSTTADASCSTSMTGFTLIGTTTEASYVNSSLSQQDYYYCVKACDSTGNCSAPSETVTMYPDGRWESAPSLTASPSATVKTRSAKILWSTNRTSSSFVKYGKTSGSYGEEVGSSTQVTAHEVSLKELDPGATYYYKVLWSDEDGNTSSSDEYSFTTNAAPNVADVKITDVSISTAYVTANITYATEATLQYGPTTAYGGSASIPVSKTGGLYSVKLEDLEQDTLYHMRIVAEDDEGNVYNGEDKTFQTLPVPKITNVKAQQVAGLPTATVRLLWSSNTEISTIVTYYPTAHPEQAKDKINLTRSLLHELVIGDLVDETDYTILVKGRDVVGNEAVADVLKLKTAADLRAPEILNLTVESTIVGIGDDAKAQIIVCWDTDEPASTQVEYNLGTSTTYGSTTQEDTNLTTNHCTTISGAQPAQIYQLRALSKDKSGNNGASFDTVIVTPAATKDVLNLVVNKLSSTFGFLKRFAK